MAEYIYSMVRARKAVGDKLILDDVTMSFLPGVKIGVVGPNGAGKSTILKIMAGLDTPSNGEARLSPGYTVGILMQEPELDETKTVLENVQEGVAEIKAKVDRHAAIGLEMAEPDADFDALLAEMGTLQEEIDAADAWDLDSQLEQAMDALRTPPSDSPVNTLSGGEKRRVALTKLLLQKPDLLLLDEPTNHLDAESVLWLEQHLAKYPGAVLAVTHDRYFLDNVAQWIAEVDRGKLYPYEGNYSTYLETKAKRLEVQGKKDQKLQKRLKDELAWVRSGAKARQAKNKARLQRYEEMVTEAEKTRKLDFEEIQIPVGPRLGSVVVEVEHLDKGFGGRQLIKDLSFTLPRNGIVGVIGPNGVGKTTLFKTIVGLEEPDSGTVKVGETVNTAVRDGNELVTLDQVMGRSSITTVIWTGQRQPLHVTAGGKVFLSAMTSEEFESYLAGDLVGFTEKTIVDPAALHAEIDRVREVGYAYTFDELEPGLAAIGAPIRALDGSIEAAVALTGPTFRVNAETLPELVGPLLEAAAAISVRNGYPLQG